MILAFNKPYGVLSQFTQEDSDHKTLAAFGFPPDVYPIGRLDADSEGLLLLSDEPKWNARILSPKVAHPREYWVQVEQIPSDQSLDELRRGMRIRDYKTLPCRAWRLDPAPMVPARTPPIRYRKTVPDCWIALELVEGKNRQVRHMTAAIGHPTLRLIRVRIGQLWLGELSAGQWQTLTTEQQSRLQS